MNSNADAQEIIITTFSGKSLRMIVLANGATAYVVSDNSTSLVIGLSDGNYVILGTNETSALVMAFSKYVHPVRNITVAN